MVTYVTSFKHVGSISQIFDPIFIIQWHMWQIFKRYIQLDEGGRKREWGERRGSNLDLHINLTEKYVTILKRIHGQIILEKNIQ